MCLVYYFNIVDFRVFFYFNGDKKDEVYFNFVFELVLEIVYWVFCYYVKFK